MKPSVPGSHQLAVDLPLESSFLPVTGDRGLRLGRWSSCQEEN